MARVLAGQKGTCPLFRNKEEDPMAIFDTHAHYDSSAFKADRDEVLTALSDAGVQLVVNAGCDLPSSRFGMPLAAFLSIQRTQMGPLRNREE